MTRKELTIGVVALIIFALCVFVLYVSDGASKAGASDARTLITYTEEGFKPSHAVVQSGDTVRFVNDSPQKLWVAAAAVTSGDMYPDTTAACMRNDFDSCAILGHHGYWDFTIEKRGVWGYRNTANPVHAATLEVR